MLTTFHTSSFFMRPWLAGSRPKDWPFGAALDGSDDMKNERLSRSRP